MTLSEADQAIHKIIKKIEHEGFVVSLVGNISCCSNGLIGSTIVGWNPDTIIEDIIADHEEPKPLQSD